SRLRLLEPWIGRKIGAAAHDVHGEAGDPELLPAVRVKLAHLGHRGSLPLEANELEASLLHGLPCAHLPLARPADPALDVADERRDAARGAGGLLPLERHERSKVLAVGEVELDEATREQGTTHQNGEKHHVLPEQPASRPDGAPHLPSRRPESRGYPRQTAHFNARDRGIERDGFRRERSARRPADGALAPGRQRPSARTKSASFS